MRLNNSMQKFRAAIEETPRADVTYILGDFNAKIGERAEADIVGEFGLGERNEAGDRLKFDTNKIGPSYANVIRKRFELLAIEENQEAKEIWENVKVIVVETAEKHVLYKKPTRSAKWISEETIAIAEERRRAKMTRSRDEVRHLNAMFQQAARKDKEKYWNEECAREEEAYRKGNVRELYQHVKKTRRAFMAREATIRGRNGEELHDQEGIRKRWKEYTEQLYAGNNIDEQAEEKPLELEPDILEDEVVWAMKQLKKSQVLMAYH
ncbi:Hypothetical predicted protein [Octopus vulgaris]|uniref:Craniofacial development protein 2-like n=1 Tax=Octopus vulgaris TaxID=6645 RepID=A0AA36EWX7_OCTVU|nr:Hypothetical predicted protein [Octopus vulgaris]